MNQRTNNQRGGGRGGYQNDDQQAPRYNALVLHEARLPMPATDALAQYGVDAARWQALTDAVFPSAKTVQGVMLALQICKARNLDVFKRVVHVVPMWSTKYNCEIETIWPGIAEARITATRTGVYAGTDPVKFGRVLRKAFSGTKQGGGRNGNASYTVNASCPEIEFPETAQMTVYKIVAGVRCAFVGPEVSFMEMFSGQKGLRVPNDRWQQAPRQMLEKCAEAAALRRAFPEELGGEWFAEEMAGKDYKGEIIEGQAVRVDEPQQQDRSSDIQSDPQQVEDAEIVEGDQFWDSDRVSEYEKYIDQNLDRARSIKKLDEFEKAQGGNFQYLAREDQERIGAMFDKRRRQLTPIAKSQNDLADGQGFTEGGQPPIDQSGQPNPAQSQQGTPETPFLRNLSRDLDAITSQVDLSSYESGNRRFIEEQALDVAEAARAIINAKREHLRKA